MPRIRTIKPEFPQSESVGRLSRDARLVFILLWTICDDEGRTRAPSRMLASLLLPYDEDAGGLMEGWLKELEREHCIQRFVADDNQYLQIVNWEKHQKIDRPSKSRIPDPPKLLASPRECSRALDADLGPRTLDLGPKTLGRSRKSATRPSESFERFWKAYPKRQGPNPKKPALKAFERELQRGFDPEVIIKGAERFAAEERKAGRIGTPYVCQAVTWLNQNRWGDYAPPPERPINGHAVEAPPTPEQLAERKRLSEVGATMFDEFGYIKPF